MMLSPHKPLDIRIHKGATNTTTAVWVEAHQRWLVTFLWNNVSRPGTYQLLKCMSFEYLPNCFN